MVKINIVCVGNLKEKFFEDAQNEYLKRLSSFAKLDVIEIAEKNQEQSIGETLEKEGQLILKQLKGYVILLEINSKQMSSEDFSLTLKKLEQSESQFTFVIGGSYGVSDKVKAHANEEISFSKMTFPHRLARIMLLEQIYRAYMIDSGRSYHK